MAHNQDILIEAATQKLSDLQAAKREWSQRLLQPATRAAAHAMAATASPVPTQNVVGVGIGEKISDGKPTGIMAVKFLVQIKYPENQLEGRTALPRSIDGLPVDVEQVGLFRRLAAGAAAARRAAAPLAMPSPRARFRPAQPGCSIGFKEPNNLFKMAGTFGALVKKGQDLFVLSNNHVLANENQLPVGAPIFQPGLLDGGNTNTDQIAELTKAIRLRSGVFNKVDAAVAKALKKSLVSNSILFIGAPKGTTSARIDMIVHKFGRTTSYRAGRITSIATDVSVQYDTGVFAFSDQIIIVGLNGQAFSAGGDSGSLILERSTNRAVGLLFAGSATHTIANHISNVLRALQVKLA
jgi:hypothetical protein